jgi:hypothetical protein
MVTAPRPLGRQARRPSSPATEADTHAADDLGHEMITFPAKKLMRWQLPDATVSTHRQHHYFIT